MLGEISDYEVLNVIGSGSFGTCYKVQRKRDKAVFVWKAIDYGDLTEDNKELLVTEVNLLRSIKNANVVRYFGHIVHKDSTTLYVVMEFCCNGDVAALVNTCRRKKCNVQEGFVWKLLYQVAAALKAMQDQGILHRDVKPANVFLDFEYNAKLGDFGLAKDTQKSRNKGHAHSFVGTPGYMSPEVFRGDKYDGKSDVWSLGCVTYELCALKGPFSGRNMRQLARHIYAGRYDPIPSYYGAELQRIIEFMLTVNTSIRPDIRAILHHPSVVTHISTCQNMKPFTSPGKTITERETILRLRELALEEKERRMLLRENKLKVFKTDVDLDSSAGLGESVHNVRPTIAKLNPALILRPKNFPVPRKVRFEENQAVAYKWYEIDPPLKRPTSELGKAIAKPELPEKPLSDNGKQIRGKYTMEDLENAVKSKFLIGKENVAVKHTML